MTNKQNNTEEDIKNKQNDIEEKSAGKKRSKKEIALDKFDVDVTAGSKKKESKTPKPKNPFKRIAIALFPQASDTKNEKFRKIILLAAIAILIGTVAFLLYQLRGMANTGKASNKLAEDAGVPNSSINYQEPDRVANPGIATRTTAGDEEPEYIDLTPVVNTPLNVDFNYLKSINPDTKAWVKISGTLLNHAVLQKPDDDDFYIDHDFYGNYEEFSGEIFSTWRNKWDGTDDNYILFGHNLATGYGFAYLNHYVPNDVSREPLAFYKVHPTILFQRDGGESETYKVFAGIVANTDPQYGEVFDYTTKTQFNNPDDFNNYILEVMDRSWFYTDVDLQYGDDIITLSTCFWPLSRNIPTRFAILARKVRPGESEYVDTSVAERNWSPKLFEYYYQVAGLSGWPGRSWDTSKLLSY